MQTLFSPANHEDDIPLAGMVSYRLSRLQSKLNAQASKLLKENGGLSLMQWRVLLMLEEAGETTHSEIARKTGFDKGLLSRTISGMIAAGLVATTQSTSDSRQHHLKMTENGRTSFLQARPHMRKRQRELLTSLSPDQLADFFAAISRIEAVVDRSLSG